LKIESYDLQLDVNLKDLTFTGKVQIKLESESDVKLNSLDLKIVEAKANGKIVSHEVKGEDLTLKTGPFKGSIDINFRGPIYTDKLVGLYKAAYDGGYVASTQFEPVAARRMFPCLDHPAYKAEFKLTVRTEKENSAVSNMPIASERLEGSKKTVKFQKTPRMSTYLLYLGVGKFEEVKEKSGRVEYAVATVPGKSRSARYPLDIGKQSVKYFESYFAFPYTLPKLHLIAVPEFAVGAMENWGAITFREVRLLVDKNTSIQAKKRIAEIISHEVAHMWFGDLVTMKWWDDLWLNESFATFMAYKAVTHMFPKWNSWEEFVRTQTNAAQQRDSLLTTHPIQAEVHSPDEIEELFDDISYGKGASIIRMVEAFAGEENFMKGVRSYLQKYKFANATGSDLWTQVQEVSKTEAKKVMNDWIRKPGYPVLHLKLNNSKISIRQERFLLSGKKELGSWPVPVTMEVNRTTKRLLLEKEEDHVPVAGSLQSLRVNLDQTGFYRVDYGDLYSYVWKSKLSGLDKYGLISDAFAFAIQGTMKLQDYLEMVDKYLDETEILPVFEVSDQLEFLYSLSPSVADISERFHRAQLGKLQEKSDENSTELRGIMANRLALVDPEYAKQLSAQFKDYDTAEPDMKQAIATAYGRTTNDFDTLYNNYKTRASEEDKIRFISALASFKQPALITRALNLALSGEIKKQDVRTILAAVRANPEARQPIWSWFTTNFNWLHNILEGTGTMSRVLQLTIPYMGIGRVAEVERFFVQHKPGDVKTSIETGIERLLIYDQLIRRIEQSNKKLVEA
jgi:tricorn protease interacting factor F2/3